MSPSSVHFEDEEFVSLTAACVSGPSTTAAFA
jgi:hypothetical protein